MFDKNKVENGLLGLVGYNQPLDPNFFILDAINLQSDSGYYINDNPFASLEVLRNTQNYANIDETGFNTVLTNVTKSAIHSVCNAVFTNKETPSFIDRQLLYK